MQGEPLVCRLENVQQYVPPERDHPLAERTPFSGLEFRQRRIDGRTRQELPPLVGRTIRSQCQAVTAQGKRCRRCTTFDYRYCWVHVMTLFRLMVAPTTVPGLKGWGLFAVDPRRYAELGLDPHKRPVRDDSLVLFARNEVIGGDHCYFVGELVPLDEHERRHPPGSCGAYVLGYDGDEEHMLDGLVARTVEQFSNDAVNLNDPLYRRNYISRRTQRPVMVMPDYPVVMNADGVAHGGSTALVARGPITHGQEIFWSYSGSPAASKNRRGRFVKNESYWSGLNNLPPAPPK